MAFLLISMPLAAFAQERQVPAAVTSFEDAHQWLLTYYRHKDPLFLVPVIKFMDEGGVFDARDEQAAFLLGFLSRVFADNPLFLEGWLAELRDRPLNLRSLLWAALAVFKTPQEEEVLKKEAQTVEGEPAVYIAQLLRAPTQDPFTFEIVAPAQLEILWGLFYASGDERYLQRVIATLSAIKDGPENYYGSGSAREIAEYAKKTLLEDAARDSLVRETCVKEMARQEGAVKSALEEVVGKATPLVQGLMLRSD